MKNSPNLFSAPDLPPFLDDDDDDDDGHADEEDEAVDVDGMFLNPGITSDSSHM